MHAYNFFVTGPKFTNFLLPNTVDRLDTSWSDFATKVENCQKLEFWTFFALENSVEGGLSRSCPPLKSLVGPHSPMERARKPWSISVCMYVCMYVYYSQNG